MMQNQHPSTSSGGGGGQQLSSHSPTHQNTTSSPQGYQMISPKNLSLQSNQSHSQSNSQSQYQSLSPTQYQTQTQPRPEPLIQPQSYAQPQSHPQVQSQSQFSYNPQYQQQHANTTSVLDPPAYSQYVPYDPRGGNNQFDSSAGSNVNINPDFSSGIPQQLQYSAIPIQPTVNVTPTPTHSQQQQQQHTQVPNYLPGDVEPPPTQTQTQTQTQNQAQTHGPAQSHAQTQTQPQIYTSQPHSSQAISQWIPALIPDNDFNINVNGGSGTIIQSRLSGDSDVKRQRRGDEGHGHGQGQGAGASYTKSTLVYGTDPLQQTDIYLPAVSGNQGAVETALVFVHGGAWRTGDKQDHADIPEILRKSLPQGAPLPAIIIPNYRLSIHPDSPDRYQAKHPEHIEDVVDALTQVFLQFDALSFVQTIFLAGHSCGAHIVANIALSLPAWEGSPRHALYLEAFLPKVKDCIYLDGIFDLNRLLAEYADYAFFVEGAFGGPKPFYPAAPVPIAPPRQKGKSIVAHSRKDELLSLDQSMTFYKSLKESNFPGWFVETDFDTLQGGHDECLHNEGLGKLLAKIIQPYNIHEVTGTAQSTTPTLQSGEERDEKNEQDGNQLGQDLNYLAGNHRTPPPPVKSACLSCRTKKARCDGQQPICGQCKLKGRECVFVKSRRGGARKRKEKPELEIPSALQQFLKHLDALAVTHQSMPDLDSLAFEIPGSKGNHDVDTSLVVRNWHPNDVMGILGAYYDEIHPFQPLLPPVKHKEWVAQNILRNSPFLLACRAILSLNPNPTDPQPRSLASRALRRSTAAKLAREAQDRIDELLTEAGEDDDRLPSIETVQALCLLGLYEFGQTGNAQKNRMKLSQALQLGMEMGLHQVDRVPRCKSVDLDPNSILPERSIHVEGDDIQQDTQRRTWWVLYASYAISCLVSGKRPIISFEDSRIQTDYPASSHQDISWKSWLTGIGLNAQAMDVIMALDYNFPDPKAPPEVYPYESSDEDIAPILNPEAKLAARKKKAIYKRMVAIDAHALDLLKQAEQQAVIPLVPGTEEEVARNQQLAGAMMLAVCHIQLHRRQAFPEVALFSRKMCGLPKADMSSLPATPQTFASSERSNSQLDFVIGSTLSTFPDSNNLASTATIRNGAPDTESAATTQSSSEVGASRFASVPTSDVQGYQLTNNTGSAETFEMPFAGVLWDPAVYPDNFPTPWFAMTQGAAALYQPVQEDPTFLPGMNGIFTAETGYIGKPVAGFGYQEPTATQPIVAPQTLSKNPPKIHKAWGVDVGQSPASIGNVANVTDQEDAAEGVVTGPDGPFAPGISLSRCATAAQSIVRLEVLHRSAAMALWKGPPKWLPFCACGLVAASYAFLLLCLAVQAGENFSSEDAQTKEELEALWTNVKVLSAGLSAYGQMWDGIDLMANEVKAALEAARKLPDEIRSSTYGSPANSAQSGN